MNLHHHGDAEAPLGEGDLDLAVNVRLPGPPAWLQARLSRALATLGSYPQQDAARAAVAERHARRPCEVLLTSGAAEAFALLARTLTPRRAVCVHPSFTLPEAALHAAGHGVEHVVLEPPFELRGIPADADLVVLGNPTNPTGRLHHDVAALARPGRTLVVDEAFMDAVPGETESLAGLSLPGVVVVRSITKTWGLAGLRAGYLLAEPALVEQLAAVQGPWAVSSLALESLAATAEPAAVAWAAARAAEAQADRRAMAAALSDVVEVVESDAPFLLLRVPQATTTRERLRRAGIRVRRGDTFPGLEADEWIRVAVVAQEHHARIVRAFAGVQQPPPPRTQTARRGHVTLVGAGPGGADLVTLRGWAALHAADVVVADRLADAALVSGLAPHVEVIDAGKAPGQHRLTQTEINAVLVDRARRGLDVVRLKGGDPFVLGRGGEEVLAVTAAGLGCTVVPGVSSATSAALLAGIPVTHRGVAQSFAVVSGHLAPDDPSSVVDWAGLASSVDTLVLLMAVANLPAIAGALLKGGRDPQTPVACIERAGSPDQRVVRTALEELDAVQVANPAVVVIGLTVDVLPGL